MTSDAPQDTAAAIDPRLATEVARRLDKGKSKFDLYLGSSVQEENGLHGARAMASRERFDAMLALDVGLVGDIPTVHEKEYEARLGGGPTLVHKDAGAHYDKRLLWRLAVQLKWRARRRERARHPPHS